MPCSPVGTTSSGRRRISRPKLLATCRRQLLSTVYSIDYAARGMTVPGLLLCFFLDVADTRALLLPRFPLHSPLSFPFPFPFPSPLLSFRPRSRPRSHLAFAHSPPPGSRFRPIPVPITVHVPVPDSDPVPVSVPSPNFDPDPVRPFPSLGPGYPLGTMRVYRHRALRTELSSARKRHSLSAEMMTRAEIKCLP